MRVIEPEFVGRGGGRKVGRNKRSSGSGNALHAPSPGLGSDGAMGIIGLRTKQTTVKERRLLTRRGEGMMIMLANRAFGPALTTLKEKVVNAGRDSTYCPQNEA